jgi:putative drug exporter of the RND superfamily
MAELLYRIGRFATRRRGTVVLAWLAVLAVAVGAFVFAGGSPNGQISIPGTPTAQVTDRLEAAFPKAADGSGTIVFHTKDGSPISDAQQAAIADRIARASKVGGVGSILNPFTAQAARKDQAAQIASGRVKLADARSQVTHGQVQIDDAKAKLTHVQAQLNAAKKKLAAGQAQLDAAKAKLPAAQAKIDANRMQLAQGQAQLNEAKKKLAAGQAQLNAGKAQLADKQAQLNGAPAKLATETKKLEAGATLLDLASGMRLVSNDGSAAIAMVSFTAPQMAVTQATKDALVVAFKHAPVDGVSVDFSSSIASALPALVGPAELVGLVIASIVLFTLLGTLVAAGLPILTALIGVGIATLGALSLSSLLVMTSVTPVLGIMLGLAVGIDYALFIVNRHRRQLREGYSVNESIALANGTSGNAVVFAGMTVIIALVALNVTGIPFLGLMGSIGAASVAIAVLIAVTLTPALLSFAGMRVMRGREKARIETGAHARPAPAKPLPTVRALGQVAVGIAVLVVLALPAASMRLGLPVGSSEATSSTQYRAYTTITDKFGEGQNGTLLVIADLPAGTTDTELLEHQVQVAKAISALDNVSAVAPVLTSTDHTIAAFQVVPTAGPTSVSTERLVADIRAASPLPGGITLGVAGQTSAAIDISQKLADALPAYLVVVLGLSLLIMVVVFRSLLVPLVATGGFALSLFAALGGTVAIYQWGWLGGLFGVSDPSPILNFLPTMLAGILFGLAMDYTLFLASGMREAFAHGAPARTAVVLGFKAGRAVVTAAAIIMVSVFGGFIFSDSAMIRPIGFALAFGVLVDAFVVRMVILPGLMHLLGDRTWWLPGWLDRLIPNVDVEGAALERKHPHVAGEPLEEPHGDPAPARPAALAD